MTTETNSEKGDIKAELLGLYNKTLDQAREYLDRKAECERLGIVVVAAHRWAVVLNDNVKSSVSLDAEKRLCLKTVPGHLCGISLFTREDAHRVAAEWTKWAPESIKGVRVILDNDLVEAVKADAETQIAFLNRL